MGHDGLSSPVDRLSRHPKALRYAVLALLWVFPSLGAVWILAINWKVWANAATVLEAVRTTRIEQWIALGLLVMHGLFLFGALRHRTRQP
jgi:hypothetical protein